MVWFYNFDKGITHISDACLFDSLLKKVISHTYLIDKLCIHSIDIVQVSSFSAFCILTTHLLIVTKFHYLPESVAVVIVGEL